MIIKAPHIVLTTPAQPITEITKDIKVLIDDMKRTLIATKNPKGVGLAAPQVGAPYKLFITKPTEKAAIRVFINPEILKESNEGGSGDDKKLEGCLSIPNVWGKVNRSHAVTLQYMDERGVSHTETFTGFLATIIQHETDHTHGVLYTQRVLEQKGKLFQIVKDKEGKEVFEEITI